MVNLTWEAITESHISSYNIYRTAEAGGDYALIGAVAARPLTSPTPTSTPG